MSRPMALVSRKHSVLTTPAELIDDPTDPEILALAGRMLATVRVKMGIAIAAPQVGVPLRLVVNFEGFVLVNPVITSLGEESDVTVESCLSIPGRSYEVSRATACVVTASDLHGEEIISEAEGFEARVLQHELDHLDGRLISSVGREVGQRAGVHF